MIGEQWLAALKGDCSKGDVSESGSGKLAVVPQRWGSKVKVLATVQNKGMVW